MRKNLNATRGALMVFLELLLSVILFLLSVFATIIIVWLFFYATPVRSMIQGVMCVMGACVTLYFPHIAFKEMIKTSKKMANTLKTP